MASLENKLKNYLLLGIGEGRGHPNLCGAGAVAAADQPRCCHPGPNSLYFRPAGSNARFPGWPIN